MTEISSAHIARSVDRSKGLSIKRLPARVALIVVAAWSLGLFAFNDPDPTGGSWSGPTCPASASTR